MLISDYSTRTSEVQGEKIFLDLSEINLFGFHKEVDDRTINSMLDEIRKGREFRSVYVVRGKDRGYYLTCIIDSERGGLMVVTIEHMHITKRAYP